MYMEFADAKYGFSKMHHYDGFLHIGSHTYVDENGFAISDCGFHGYYVSTVSTF